jgi:hypothetical protein
MIAPTVLLAALLLLAASSHGAINPGEHIGSGKSSHPRNTRLLCSN